MSRVVGFLAGVLLLLLPVPAAADVVLPPGFRAEVYVTGEGFDPGGTRAAPGIPSMSTAAIDEAGVLYLARPGRRYVGGDVEDLWPIYRFPVGGARLRAETQARYLYGPPLPNPQVATIRHGRDLFVTTFNRDRKVGVLYHVRDGRAELVAGGTPPPGEIPLLRQPEGVAADAAGNLYVADRRQGVVVKLDPAGRLLDPHYVSVVRPRGLAVDGERLWVAADGEAEAPWQRGPGELWQVTAGVARLVLRGPVAAGIALAPGGHLVVADRHGAKLFVVGPDGRPADFATFTDGDAPRTLAFAPATAATSRAGIAGDLFVITIRRGAWPVNEVLRISGPFEEFLAKH